MKIRRLRGVSALLLALLTGCATEQPDAIGIDPPEVHSQSLVTVGSYDSKNEFVLEDREVLAAVLQSGYRIHTSRWAEVNEATVSFESEQLPGDPSPTYYLAGIGKDAVTSEPVWIQRRVTLDDNGSAFFKDDADPEMRFFFCNTNNEVEKRITTMKLAAVQHGGPPTPVCTCRGEARTVKSITYRPDPVAMAQPAK